MSGVARTVLREQVKELLAGRIIRGEIGPGEPLVETRIAQELGTSQAPVREALRDLALLGLVETEPFRSARVRQISEKEVFDSDPVLAALDELATRMACVKLAGDVSGLEPEVEAMRSAAADDDRPKLITHNLAFHRFILDASENTSLAQCWASLGVEALLTLTIYRDLMSPAAAPVPIIARLRRARRPAAAGREARKHVLIHAKLARAARPGR